MTQANTGWSPYENGKTIGQRGSEHGLIMLDEEHSDGARITLEREGESAPFAISCGMYGWFLHTRFFAAEETAKHDFTGMKAALAKILSLAPSETEDFDHAASIVKQKIWDFVERFP